MAGLRESIKLSDEEIHLFVEASKTVIVGTNNHDGVPHLVPMWFALIDGLIHMHTYKRSQKVVNLARDNRGSLLVEDGHRYDELRGVFMRGRYDIVDDQELCFRIGLMSAVKYSGISEEEAAPFVRNSVRKRVALVFHPEKITSWDHRKLAGAGSSYGS